MRYFFALATDYDATLTHDGVVSPATVEAPERFWRNGAEDVLVAARGAVPTDRGDARLDSRSALCAKLIRLFFLPSLPPKLRKPSAPSVPVSLPAAGTDT